MKSLICLLSIILFVPLCRADSKLSQFAGSYFDPEHDRLQEFGAYKHGIIEGAISIKRGGGRGVSFLFKRNFGFVYDSYNPMAGLPINGSWRVRKNVIRFRAHHDAFNINLKGMIKVTPSGMNISITFFNADGTESSKRVYRFIKAEQGAAANP